MHQALTTQWPEFQIRSEINSKPTGTLCALDSTAVKFVTDSSFADATTAKNLAIFMANARQNVQSVPSVADHTTRGLANQPGSSVTTVLWMVVPTQTTQRTPRNVPYT